MTIYYYHSITESVTLSTYLTADQVDSHIDGIIYFEAEAVLDQTIDESVWKPYVKSIEVGDIVQAESTLWRFRVLGIHEDRLWVKNLGDSSDHPGHLVRAADFQKAGGVDGHCEDVF